MPRSVRLGEMGNMKEVVGVREQRHVGVKQEPLQPTNEGALVACDATLVERLWDRSEPPELGAVVGSCLPPK